MKAAELQNMFEVYHQFVKLVDMVRQYDNVHLQERLFDSLPSSLQKLLNPQEGMCDDRLFAIELAKHIYTYMEWDESGALPRRNNVLQVFEQKRGRCGEYANLFAAFLKACRIRARVIFDFTDHVWVEILPSGGVDPSWIPLDCTLLVPDIVPNFRDKMPLSYIIAVESNRLEDVTKRYTEQWEEVKKRRNMPWVDMMIEMFNLGSERLDWDS